MSPPVLQGEIETPRPLRATGGKVSVRGWCVLAGQPDAPPIRLVTTAHTLPMTSRVARPDLPALLPAEPAAGQAGFLIEGVLSPGVHHARFEAQLPDGTWQLLRQLTLAAEAPPFLAALDEPISTGTLTDRVKVGGWAFDPAGPITSLYLRYGHRRIPCVINRPRADVAALFASAPHAAHAGFVSEDFLVAGHGPVRIEARLAGGGTAIVPTTVSFSIATDENHAPELELTAPRFELPAGRPQPPTRPTPTDRPLNILFLLPGSFASNHALHVAALANELAAAGHTCTVAVAHDRETLHHLDRPAFHGITHAEARQYPEFLNGRLADVIHVWTTRENVRLLAEQLRSRHHAPVIVHLEDNEQQILAQSLGLSLAEIAQLPDAKLAALVPPDLSHPRLSRGFLLRCDGVTVILDRLREFVPAGKPCLPLMPAADARHFYPRPVPAGFRAVLGLAPDTTILFYHGNVHASNATEVRELYAAVLALNRTGTPVTLLRTGLDRVDFLGDLGEAVAPHVLALGLIQHHHHLPALMALADIFVQPGVPDAFNDYRFPSKLPEFFALGRPVVLPRTNLGTSLRHGTDAWVLDRADAAGIAGAVRTLQADPALRAKLGAGAAAYAAEHFNWPRRAAALATFYATLAKS